MVWSVATVWLQHRCVQKAEETVQFFDLSVHCRTHGNFCILQVLMFIYCSCKSTSAKLVFKVPFWKECCVRLFESHVQLQLHENDIVQKTSQIDHCKCVGGKIPLQYTKIQFLEIQLPRQLSYSKFPVISHLRVEKSRTQVSIRTV